MSDRRFVQLPDGTVHELGDNDVVPSGATVRRSILMMDSTTRDGTGGSQPAARSEDYERGLADAAWWQMADRISNAWRSPNVAAEQGPPAASPAEAYAAMVDRITNGWRGPVR